MDIFANIKSLRHTNAHGEINFYKIEGDIDHSDFEQFSDTSKNGDYIVGHSESGNCHVLERTSGLTIKQREHKGMKMLFAILENPTRLYQDAGSPHAEQIVEPGTYLIGTSLDYDPFTQQAKRVAD